MLGEIFEGNGVVVAPPQKGERALWDAITVALVVPPPEGDEEPLGLNGVIEQATSGLREAGQDFVTVQRQQRTVDHKPAQMLKGRYHEKPNGRDWTEEMVFIEGPDNEIYSVALKCSPLNLARLEPTFSQVLASWTLPKPEPPAGETEEAYGSQNSYRRGRRGGEEHRRGQGQRGGRRLRRPGVRHGDVRRGSKAQVG